MDQQKLRTLVFEKTGVKIDLDDPVFALVAMNEAVLEEAVERHVARIDEATRELALHARAAGGLAAVPAVPVTAATLWQQEKRTIVIAAGSAVLGALVVLLAQAILG